MVVLMVAVTVLSVMTAASLPNWSAISQRDKEEELIFRGLQYAEAIRVFQVRYGRYPVKLDELYKVKPRCIRQLYPDPMSESGEWGLIYANGPGNPVNAGNPGRNRRGGRQDQRRGGRPIGIDPPEGAGSAPTGLPESEGGPGNQGGPGRRRVAAGPILGVYSKASSDQTFKVFMDQEQYDQWAFTADLVSGVANAPDRPPQVPSARTLGRPFPDGIQPAIDFSAPQQGENPNGLQPNDQRRRGSQRGGFGVPQPSTQGPDGQRRRPQPRQ